MWDPCRQRPPGAVSSVPGISGINVIRRCYRELFGTFGPSLFDTLAVMQAPVPVLQALQECHHAPNQEPVLPPRTVQIWDRGAVCIPLNMCQKQIVIQSIKCMKAFPILDPIFFLQESKFVES